MLSLAVALVPGVLVHAQPGARVDVTLVVPDTLVPGDRAEVVCEARFDPPSAEPVLVTPGTDGAAVEVVRGRLLRVDAEDPGATPLRFRIPIIARAPGAAVLRVRVDGHSCSRGRCRRVRGEATVTLRVAPPR